MQPAPRLVWRQQWEILLLDTAAWLSQVPLAAVMGYAPVITLRLLRSFGKAATVMTMKCPLLWLVVRLSGVWASQQSTQPHKVHGHVIGLYNMCDVSLTTNQQSLCTCAAVHGSVQELTPPHADD